MTAPLIHFFAKRRDLPKKWRSRFRVFTADPNAQGPPDFDRSCKGLAITPFEQVPPICDDDNLHWEQLAEGHWIGAVDLSQPDCHQIRPDVIGVPVMLGDGQEWYVPRINPQIMSTCDLLKQDKLVHESDTAGKLMPQVRMTTVIAPCHADLADRGLEICQQCWQSLAAGNASPEIDDAILRQLLADCLSMNYDLSVEEISVLGLFSRHTCSSAILTIIQWSQFLELHMSALWGDSD